MVFNINTRIKRAGQGQKALECQSQTKEALSLRITSYTHLFWGKGLCSASQPRSSYNKLIIWNSKLADPGRNSGSLDGRLPGFLDTTKRELSSLDGRSPVPANKAQLVGLAQLNRDMSSARCTHSALYYILARFARSERQMLTPSPILGCAQGTKHTEHNQEHHNIRTYNQHNQHNDPALYWQGMYCIDDARVDVAEVVVVATNGQSFLNFQIEKLKNSWRQERYEANERKEV